MKSKIVLPLLLIPIFLLSACGAATTATAQGGTNQQALPLAEKLAIGTLKLEGTESAISAKQAADLLPLWQVYSSLITSDTAAQEEKDALAEQIQETMSSEQIKAIEALNLTQRDVFASMQQLGITTTSQVSANETPQPNGGGAFPGGGQFIGGGGAFPGGGNGAQLSPQQIATAQARRAANGGGFNNNRLLTPLVEAVIKLLESK